jgi:four helix bundle protein
MVYVKLCRLHIAVCELSHRWPAEEKYELGSQVRRSSNSAAAQLAEKYDDRHVRNKIEGVNRSRGEAAETVHHLYMAHLKAYESKETYEEFRARYTGVHPDAQWHGAYPRETVAGIRSTLAASVFEGNSGGL